MSAPFGPEASQPPSGGGIPPNTPGFPAPPPRSGTPLWVWLLVGGGLLAISPFCCCGGLLVYASTYKDFTLSNGQHLGGSVMNVRFDYELHNDRPTFDAYFIVAKSADGTTRERNIWGRFERRGTLHFSAFDVGQQNSRGPVKVWIEKEDMRGSRGRASNVISIYPKAA